MSQKLIWRWSACASREILEALSMHDERHIDLIEGSFYYRSKDRQIGYINCGLHREVITCCKRTHRVGGTLVVCRCGNDVHLSRHVELISVILVGLTSVTVVLAGDAMPDLDCQWRYQELINK